MAAVEEGLQTLLLKSIFQDTEYMGGSRQTHGKGRGLIRKEGVSGHGIGNRSNPRIPLQQSDMEF